MDGDGNFIISSGASLHLCGSNGTHRLQFATGGGDRSLLTHVGGIAVNPAGTVYVTDADMNRKACIRVFDRSGQLVDTFGRYGDGPGEFNLPAEIAVAVDGTIFVADTGNHRVQRLNNSGESLGSIGPVVRPFGSLRFPSGLSIRRDGERETLYIVDTFHHRVLVTDLEGGPIGEFGRYSPVPHEGPGTLLQPRSVAARGDAVYVLHPPLLSRFEQAAGRTPR